MRFDWRRLAACRDEDPALFFPEHGASSAPAKAICARCPVRKVCLEEHLYERHGIWGGTTRNQRDEIREERGLTGKREVVA